MSLHPSLRRPASRPSDIPIAPAPTAPLRIKQEQVEYAVHEPPSVRHPAPISASPTKAKGISTTQTPPSSSSYSIRAHIQSQPDEFLKNVFPNEKQIRFREQLFRDVISTGWWLYNEMEPYRDLCAFIPRMTDSHFQCTSCGKKFTRIDRAVDHFRVHIDHRPYQCSGEDGCGFSNCQLGFFTKDCLKAHCARTEVTCDRCGTTVEDKNLARHQGTRKCRRV